MAMTRLSFRPRLLFSSFLSVPRRQLASLTASHKIRDFQAESTWPTFQLFTRSRIGDIFKHYAPTLDPRPFMAAAVVFPMRVNNYVLDNLIDWTKVPNDPIFKLVFPQPEMLRQANLSAVMTALGDTGTSRVSLRALAESIRAGLNPHPAGQKQDNVPLLDGAPVPGMQHKYRETVLYFPLEGQFCHSYCTYCFRWAQFTSVGSTQQFKSSDAPVLLRYLSRHPQVTDVLFTGGDPMVMSAAALQKYIVPMLRQPGAENVATIRIGTKSLAYWPWRFISDPDAKSILALFEEVSRSGRQLSLQAHFSHPSELRTRSVQEAIRMIRMTGAQIRCQAPLVRHVNDCSDTWADMWNLQSRLGLVPYYMFVERDTGPRHYFSVPLSQAYNIFSKAFSMVGGTSRTVRGPSMSAAPGKVAVTGVENVAGEDVFILKFLQARVPQWTQRTFFARYDPEVTWLDELVPAFGEDKFFFEEEYQEMVQRRREGSSGQLAC